MAKSLAATCVGYISVRLWHTKDHSYVGHTSLREVSFCKTCTSAPAFCKGVASAWINKSTGSADPASLMKATRWRPLSEALEFGPKTSVVMSRMGNGSSPTAVQKMSQPISYLARWRMSRAVYLSHILKAAGKSFLTSATNMI